MSACEDQDRWQTTSPEATLALGETLGRALVGGLTIGLVGPLGSGKTHLVKGIALGNGLDDARKVTSPTFTLVHEYPGRLKLIHVDAYRLSGGAELDALGFEEFAREDAAVVIEWADRVQPTLPADALWVAISPTGETSRDFRMTAAGPMSARCLDVLRAAMR